MTPTDVPLKALLIGTKTVNGPKFCRGHEREPENTNKELQNLKHVKLSKWNWRILLTRTEESDGIAQLTAPCSSRFCVQFIQTLHEVPVANFTITEVTLDTGAPEGQSNRLA